MDAVKGGLKPALFFVLLALGPPAVAAAGVQIRWAVEGSRAAVEVRHLPPDVMAAFREDPLAAAASTVVAVWAEPAGARGNPGSGDTKDGAPGLLPALAGTWRVRGDILRFEAQFPPARGVRYRAEARAPGAPVVAYFELPRDDAPPTTLVQHVFPSSDTLPENQLKFYVQFSAPMSRGRTYEHIHIRDANGGVIDLPFLELDEELWDPAMTRLTLLIDPGRIKRGVKPLEDIGPVFEANREYALTIGARCQDAEGRPLAAGFEKKFQVGVADRTPPDPARWHLMPPAGPGSRDPVVLTFDEPMDEPLARRLIHVAGASDGRQVRGQTTLDGQERQWRFVPADAWAPGRYQVVVATTIEDLAGNNIGKSFDLELQAGGPRHGTAEQVKVAFEVK